MTGTIRLGAVLLLFEGLIIAELLEENGDLQPLERGCLPELLLRPNKSMYDTATG